MNIKTISSGTRLRDNHNTAGAIITSFAQGVTLEGVDVWTADRDYYNSTGIMINMEGDRWLYATKAGGVLLAQSGWIAITHKGLPICEVLADAPIDTGDDDPFTHAIMVRKSGAQEIWKPV